MSEHNSELWIMAHETRLHQYEFNLSQMKHSHWLSIAEWNTLSRSKYAICPGEAGGNLKEFE